MLKIVEADADSFAQRAEMYYKGRPELIRLVEEFYRAHRSLAERYDQLKSDRSIRVKSPLRNLLCPPKAEYENGFDSTFSIKSFDSFTEVAYSSDESAESEVDDPEELDDDCQVTQVDEVEGNRFSTWDGIDEIAKLREELDRLREENDIQRKQIEEFEAIKCGNAPFEEVETLKCDVVSLRLESTKQRDMISQKDEKIIEVVQKFEAAKQELIKIEAENRVLKDALKRAEEEKVEAKREVEKTSEEVVKLREEGERKDRCLVETIEEKDDEKRAVIRQLSLAMEILREDNKLLKKAVVKDSSKKRSPSMFRGVQLSRLFNPTSKCHASVVSSWY
ncbi:hypothetical protein RND81_01G135800 [Saponaria officinalis]